MTRYWAEHAWLGGDATTAGVVIEVADGVITDVQLGPAPEGAVVLAGVTLPGMANAHSHAFHRALRGRTQRGGGTFWTWREQMYAVAGHLTPDTYFALARATYAEMALAGVTCVGEFHYLHHDVDGSLLGNAMSDALVAAAAEAGIRITLLDACYLTGGLGQPLAGPQLRFTDGSAAAWASRVSAFAPGGLARVGAAIHSVRAVPADQLDPVVAWARDHAAPLHVHLSEQVAENDACVAAYGMTPTELLDKHGALGPLTTAVHATHLTAGDIALLGGSRTTVCMCPTTERDLADGIGPARTLASAGSPLSVGSDSNAVIDLLEEARAIELDERLRSQRRGHWRAADLLGAATTDGHASLGWPEVGRIARGAAADLVTVTIDSVRLAGASPLLEATVFAATAGDVREVIVAGRRVVSGGRHLLVDDVPAALASSIAAAT
ncbi:formimidoylglutamate deiminase [Acidothermaceae bacterium B102]|nr:formimidoylglutamate deiminase [Acidothermaceae bacterium B102]